MQRMNFHTRPGARVAAKVRALARPPVCAARRASFCNPHCDLQEELGEPPFFFIQCSKIQDSGAKKIGGTRGCQFYYEVSGDSNEVSGEIPADSMRYSGRTMRFPGFKYEVSGEVPSAEGWGCGKSSKGAANSDVPHKASMRYSGRALRGLGNRTFLASNCEVFGQMAT
jgi:hypothetical protein